MHQQYSEVVKTNEAIEFPTLYRRILKVSTVVQYIAGVCTTGLAMYTFSHCVPGKNYFVGLLMILSLLFLP